MDEDALEAQKLYDDQSKLFIRNQVVNEDVKKLREIVNNLAQPKSTHRILFAGCGDGVECAVSDSKGAIITAVDISPKNIEHAKSLGLTSTVFEVMDIQNLSFADNEFDILISILTIMYVKDLNPVLLGFKRVVKSDGKLILAVPHPVIKMQKYNAKDNYFLRGKQYEEWNGIKRFNYYRLIEDYSAAFNKAGLAIQSILEPEPASQTDQIKFPYFIVFELCLATFRNL